MWSTKASQRLDMREDFTKRRSMKLNSSDCVCSSSSPGSGICAPGLRAQEQDGFKHRALQVHAVEQLRLRVLLIVPGLRDLRTRA